jgi:hypothetical protein
MGGGSRLLNLSSSGHRYSNVDLDDPNFERTSYERMCYNFVVESKVGGFELRNRQWITRRMVHSAQRLARKCSANASSRLADRRKSIVAPLESTARYR